MIDYDDADSLRHALNGVHVLISTIPGNHEKALLEEAVRARVRRFMPAHFDGLPTTCDPSCPLDNHREEMRLLLAENRRVMQSCLVICGILYEYFQPGGLASGDGPLAFDYHPFNVQDMMAQIPLQAHLRLVCLTAMQDVARCITKLLERSSWPAEVRIYSERMTVEKMLASIEEIRVE